MKTNAAGAALLDHLRAQLVRYVAMPTDHAADAVTLWIVATHALPAFDYAPRLCITSAEKRSGKSRLLDVIEATAHDPLVTVNASSSAIFRSIGVDHPPTLLVDEADAMFGTKKQAEQHEDLRALINAGHQRGRPALRCVGPQQEPAEFATFAMVALAGIGTLPDTITDRAVNVAMRRRAPGEKVDQFRRRDAVPLHQLRDRLAGWVGQVIDSLADAEPVMPVEDRAADTWEPLVAVADAAGGTWPARARTAALAMTAEADDAEAEASAGVRLLADLRDVFAASGRPVLSSADLVEALKEIDEAPWTAFALDQRQLARRLRSYGVTSVRMRPDGGSQVRGYRLEDLDDPFRRYLSPVPSQSVTASKSQVSAVTDGEPVTDASVTRSGSVTGRQAADLGKHCEGDAVTAGDASGGDDGEDGGRVLPLLTENLSARPAAEAAGGSPW